MSPIALLIVGLAVWRLSHALVKETGPLMVFSRLRARFARKQKHMGGLFDAISCTSCASFWVALVASLWVAHDVFTWLGYSLAFSGFSMLIEAYIAKNSDALPLVAGPAADDKVLVRGSTSPK